MNNKEKREYISCLQLSGNIQSCYLSEINRIRKLLSMCPALLYKYKKIDKNVFDMLKNKYAYLSSVKNLDDPFDCVSDFSTSRILNQSDNEVTNWLIKHIVRHTKGASFDREQFERFNQYKKAFKPGDDFDSNAVKQMLKNENVPDDLIEELVLGFKNLLNIHTAYEGNKAFEEFGKMLLDPSDSVRVCSLSETRDNKVMWSLYGNEYKGCCIEYKIPNKAEIRRFLFPVIYTREPNNNFATKIIDSEYAELNRHIHNGNPLLVESNIEPVGSIYELFCSKDIDWRYQREWRLVGAAQDERCYDIGIKTVYLGFKVTPTNELKMIRYAKKYGFSLYKMNPPNGKKKIKYTKLI